MLRVPGFLSIDRICRMSLSFLVDHGNGVYPKTKNKKVSLIGS